MDSLAIQGACNGYIHCSVEGGLALRFQHVEVVAHRQAIFRAFPYTTVNAFFVWGHVLCDRKIRTAIGVGDIASPCMLRPSALCASSASLQRHYEEQERQSYHCSF